MTNTPVKNEKFNTIMPESTDSALCIMVDKPVSAEGYKDNFLPRARQIIEQHGKLRCLVYFKKYQGWEGEAAMMDLASTPSIGSKVHRFAVVNPPSKFVALQEIKRPMISGETRFFSEDKLQEAINWVKE